MTNILKKLMIISLVCIFIHMLFNSGKPIKKVIHIPLNEELVELKKDGTFVSKSILDHKSPFDTLYIENENIHYIFVKERLNWKDSVDRGYYQGE